MRKIYMINVSLILLLLVGCGPSTNVKKQINPIDSKIVNSRAILELDTQGHNSIIRDVLVTKSGDIISASDDKTIRVWDKNGVEKRKILGQIGVGVEGQIFTIALSPNEKFLAVGGYLADNKRRDDRGSIRIYDYKTGKLLKLLKSHNNATDSNISKQLHKLLHIK